MKIQYIQMHFVENQTIQNSPKKTYPLQNSRGPSKLLANMIIICWYYGFGVGEITKIYKASHFNILV